MCIRDSTNTVLTPHPGEAARLLGCSVAQIQTDRPAAAQELAERYGCVAVLKGSGTLMAAPGREMLHNPTGNPGLARGGSGDVLAGMLAALLVIKQRMERIGTDTLHFSRQNAYTPLACPLGELSP